MNFTHSSGLNSIIVVVPVIAAVTVAVRIVAPPALFGTFRRKEPLSISISLDPALKRKTEFDPILVIVWSGNVSSARDFLPVNRVEEESNDSPCFASCASAESLLILTSFSEAVSVADSRGEAVVQVADAMRSVVKAIRVAVMDVFWSQACLRGIQKQRAGWFHPTLWMSSKAVNPKVRNAKRQTKILQAA